MRTHLVVALIAATLAGGAAGETPPAAGASAAEVPSYDIRCPDDASAAEQCQVGEDTYTGWRIYAAHCFQCHGDSGAGTTFGPSLLDRLNQGVDYDRLNRVVVESYSGHSGVMPAWRGSPAVMPNIDRLYGYLRARADGALPPGRPARKHPD
jgi:mono/diheme cytochrome c family protein